MNTASTRREFLHRTGLLAGALAGATALPITAQSARASRASAPDTLVAFRISNEQWQREDRFGELLDFFRRQPGTADELAFFTSSTHPPLPLAEIEGRAERLQGLMRRVRAEGMRAGINLLATMGHHEENLDGSLDTPWQRVVDPHGRESRGSFCPAGDELRAYAAQVYRALARAEPDFIWIDDDVRLAGHMPIGFTCFCAGCLARFGRETGRTFDRESLLAAFGSGPWPERSSWRRRWLEHNRQTLDELFRLIEATVHAVAPGLSLGFMTGDRFYEGYDFGRWAATLAGPARVPVRWRPGGGFYSDETLSGLVGKAHDIGRQVSRLPAEVRVIQSEIENFPYDLLRKSSEATVLEATAHIAAGCTGTAFNVLSQRPDPLGEYEPLLRRIARVKPFHRVLREELGRAPLVGVWPAWTNDIHAANSPEGPWPEGAGDAVSALTRSYVLGELGIPLCYAAEGARVTVLAGSAVHAFDEARLRGLFAGGVLLDVAAWHALGRLGLAEALTGVRPLDERSRDTLEVLAEHPLNGRFAGWSRDCRQSFWREPVHALEPVGPAVGKVEVLARRVDYQGRDFGASMTAFVNPLGGRVVTMGYYPWSQLHHLAKSTQMKAVCDWLAGGRVPVRLESFARVHLWVREPAPGRLAAVLLNASLDPVPGPELTVAGDPRRFRWIGMDARSRSVRVLGPVSGGVRLRLPALGAWTAGLLVATA